MSGSSLLVDIIHFAAFADSTDLLYTKYNFNYDLWAEDYGLDPNDKLKIFRSFLVENETTYDKPYSVKPEFEKYFFPITAEIINYMTTYGYSVHSNYIRVTSPPTYFSAQTLLQQQFDLVPYTDQEIQRLSDYFFLTKNGIKRSKYNFLFDLYSKDWKVYGSKLFIFSDFEVRQIFLSGTVPGTTGYGIAEGFEKYFEEKEGLNEYLVDYGVTSVFPSQYKQVNNINWLSYRELNPDLDQKATIHQLIEHYYLYGQFELRKFNFNNIAINNIQRAENSVGLVYAPGNRRKLIGSGFLIENRAPTSIISTKYLITTYHLIEDSKNKVTLRSIFSLNNPNEFLKQPVIIEAEFIVIGYYKTLDILVAVYNPNSEWNISNKVDINKIPVLRIDDSIILQKNDLVNYIGNINQNGLQDSLSGNVIDDRYFGEFLTTYDIAPPQTYIININSVAGVSGSPLLVYRNTSYVCVGMITNRTDIAPMYTQAIRADLLIEYIQKSINYFAFLSNLYFGNFYKIFISLQSAASDSICWLGAYLEYFDAINSRNRYDALSSLNYYGGVLITDIILGFNPVTRSFVVNTTDIVDLNVIQISSPLLNTQLQTRFIESGYQPIVLKSMETYVGTSGNGTYQAYYFGKYGDQRSFANLSYGLVPVGTYQVKDLQLPTPYINVTYNIYPTIILNYFYFSGIEWKEESITLNFTELDLIQYKDNLGNIYLQNPLNYPAILIPYAKAFYDNMSNASLFRDPVSYWNGPSVSGTMLTSISNAFNSISNPIGSISNSVGSVSNAFGSVSNAFGSVSNAFGSVSNSFGSVSNPFGSISNAYGSISNTLRSISNGP